jgi:hypothetical protein
MLLKRHAAQGPKQQKVGESRHEGLKGAKSAKNGKRSQSSHKGLP